MRSNTSKGSGSLVAVGLFFLVGGCTDSGDGGAAPTPIASAETVESRPGIVQVGDDDGPVLGEAETCERFRAAVVRNRERLACDEFALLECPELIRPLASLPCVPYSEASLTTCLAAFDAASDCDGLLPGACVLTAVLFQVDPACVADASSGDAGDAATGAVPDGGATSSGGLRDAAADGSVAGETNSLEGGADSSAPVDATHSTSSSVGDAGASFVAAVGTHTSNDAGATSASNTAPPADGG